MKKIFWLLAFVFIGAEVYSQMYIVSIGVDVIGGCSSPPQNSIYELTLSTISPTGNITHDCIPSGYSTNDYTAGLAIINEKLNDIISMGYKLIHIDYNTSTGEGGYTEGGGTHNGVAIRLGTTYYLAIP